MHRAGGQIADLANAFEIANVEMLVVALPAVEVVACTRAALARWNCREEDVVGRKLAKYGAGPISARYMTDDVSGAQKVEIVFAPPLGQARISHFTPQSWQADGCEFMILIGQHGSQAEAETAIQNERRLQLALRSGGYALWDYDYRSRLTTNSPEIYEMLGFEEGAVDLDFVNFNARIHPDDLDKTLDEKIRNAPFGADLFQTKYRVRAKNGGYIWIEAVAGLVRDPVDGKPAKVVGLCRNIQTEMTALESISVSERNLRRSQAAARIGSFHLRLDTGASTLSAEMIELLELKSSALPPTLSMFEQMIAPADQARFRDAVQAARLGAPPAKLEIAARLASGEQHFFQCNIEAERGSSGTVEAIFGTCQCITDRRLLERKYLQAQKMEAVGQLTGGIAHDFNNLLMVVMGNLQLVDQLVRHDERAAKRLRAAIDATDRGSDLTRRLLAFSRQQTLQNEAIEINTLITAMQDMLSHALGGRVDLKILPGDGVWPVSADPTQLETAILNLAINGRDAMTGKTGTLVIETTNRTLDETYCRQHEEVLPGRYVEIAVTDSGCGIPAADIEKVFQPFFTTKDPEAGSGLGLSMTYGFVKQSGGHIRIYSEVGHGTTVKLYLPVLASAAIPDEKPVPATQSTPEEAAVAIEHAPVVLVVEDNEAVREVAAAMISEMGIETLQAANGPEGLELIEQRSDIDLILSDVIMAGGMNGPELAKRARQLNPHLKILFMSGYAPGSVRQIQDLPEAVELVNKPFTRSD
ncbi:MAG: PAS domain-containing protein, partial [Rhizobiales bacterium]|nr:PAS domain-containing protein [Hyphomicrobiales bacterium]